MCLLAPNRTSICILLNICETFSKEYDVQFNSKKSHLVLFDDEGKYRNMVELKLNGEELHLQKSATHLGHPVGGCNVTGIDQGKNDLIWRTNYVMSRFGCCSANVRSYLFRTYCTSYYGSPLWKLDSKRVQQFYTTWRKCVRKIWNVPYRTHCNLLCHLYEGPGIEADLLKRFMVFYTNVINSSNPSTRMCGILCQFSKTSAATNRRLFLAKINDDGSALGNVTTLKNVLYKAYDCNVDCRLLGNVVRELCCMRDGQLQTDLNKDDINFMIDRICTD